MKFCRPIYRLLNKQNPELANKTFLTHVAFYVRPSPAARSLLTRRT
jgi:leukotriene-A4 hydrolase